MPGGINGHRTAGTSAEVGYARAAHVLGQPLREAGIKAGREALFDILSSARPLVRPRRAYNKTTDSHHRCLRHPNLLKAGEGQIGDAHRAPGQFGGGKCGDELWTTARRAEDGQIWPAKSGSYNGVDCPLPKRLRLGRSDTEA